MHVNVLYRPAHALAQITLEPNESIQAESGAMVGMSTNVAIQTQAGGMMSGLKRMFGGESFFRNTFTAQGGPGELLLAPPLNGDIAALEMTSHGYFVQSSCYVASSPHVQIDTKVGGFRGFFSGAGMFVLKATAQQPGHLIVASFGGLDCIQCDGSMVIDTGHLVAWDATLEYRVTKASSGWIASLLSGEGLVCEFKGQGRIWIQTRNQSEYGRAIGPNLPPREQ